jgi:hypothetical protein
MSGIRDMDKILIRKPEGKRPFGDLFGLEYR